MLKYIPPVERDDHRQSAQVLKENKFTVETISLAQSDRRFPQKVGRPALIATILTSYSYLLTNALRRL
jgi:hypothetical protein